MDGGGGGRGYSLIACIRYLTVDYAYLSRRKKGGGEGGCLFVACLVAIGPLTMHPIETEGRGGGEGGRVDACGRRKQGNEGGGGGDPRVR